MYRVYGAGVGIYDLNQISLHEFFHMLMNALCELLGVYLINTDRLTDGQKRLLRACSCGLIIP